MTEFFKRVMAASLAMLLASCGDPATVPEPVPGIRVLAGGDISDTVEATPAQPLEVEVRGPDRRPLAGARVLFYSPGAPAPSGCAALFPWKCGTATGMGVRGESREGYAPHATDTTDTRGRARVWIRMGKTAGTARVVVTLPDHGMQDTVRYTVLTGGPGAILLLPADTAVYAGAAYSIRATPFDRHGNPRADPVTFSSPDRDVAVGGASVRAVSIGRAAVVARAGSYADTARVSIVPRGTLALQTTFSNYADTVSLVVVGLDGSGYRRVVDGDAAVRSGVAIPPDWSPDGKRLVFSYDAAGPHLYTVDIGGPARRLMLPVPGLQRVFDPRFSRDGGWVYFSGDTQLAGQNFHSLAIWRVRADGTGAERIGPAPRSNVSDMYPSPSPDGARVAFSTRPGGGMGTVVRILDVATRQVGAPVVSGSAPRWSRSGTWIAYFYDGGLGMVRPDGTGMRTVIHNSSYDPPLEWSPDERFLVAYNRSTQKIELVEVATGERLPLTFSKRLASPAWMP